MKKIIYILFAVLLVAACTKVPMDSGFDSILEEHDAVYPDGASIDLQFAVPIPPSTKGAMNDLPDMANDKMYVAVFDGSGSLKEYKEATFIPVTQNGSPYKSYFKVTLYLKSSECRLHFIVNGPAPNDVGAGGTENALFQQWMTEYPNAAYWQRVVLPEGITAYSFSSTKPGGGAWADGDMIYYYYKELSPGVYEHVSVTTTQQTFPEGSGVLEKAYEISVSNGRASYLAASSTVSFTVNPGDFVKANGEKILDGTGYFQSILVSEAVSSIPLVRNFARIKVKAGSGGNFTPTQYYLMNIPNKGFMAPYSNAAGGFASPYSVSNYVYDPTAQKSDWVTQDPLVYVKTEGTGTNHSDLLDALEKSGYPADMPSSATLIQTVAEVKTAAETSAETAQTLIASWQSYGVGNATATVDNTPSAFIFERGLPNKNQDPTYLLIGGTLTDAGTRWFKVELTDGLGKYFRIYRDMTYFIEIGNIEGSTGYATAVEAALGSPVSDVSNSTATETLEQVSDGKNPGTSIWVSYIDYVSTGVTNETSGEQEGEKVAILYKVFTSGSATNAALSPTYGENQPRYTLSASGEAISSVSNDAAYSGTDTPDGQGDWRYAEVQLAKPAVSGIIRGTLEISGVTTVGEVNGKTLSRKVNYSVMNTQRLTLAATALPSEAAGEETKLTITLPEGLGFSLFPLVLRIEAESENMNPVNTKNLINGKQIDLPVDTGTSYFTGKNSFGFLFTLNYSDYYSNGTYKTSFDLYFKTTKDYSGANATGTNATYFSVTDQKGKFFYKPENASDLYNPAKNYAIAKVKVAGSFVVSPATQSVGPEATTASFSINAEGDWSVTGGSGVQFVSGSSTVNSLEGNGDATVTMKFTANPDNTARDLTATVTYEGVSKTATVTQEAPSINLNAESASVSAATTSYQFDVNSNLAWTAEIIDSGDDVSDVVLDQNTTRAGVGDKAYGNGNGTVRLTFREGGTAPRTIKIKISDTAGSFNVSKILTLTQRRQPYEKTKTETIAVNSSSFNNSYVYTGNLADVLPISMANGSGRNNGYIQLDSSSGSVTIKTTETSLSSIDITYVDDRNRYNATSMTATAGTVVSTTSWTNNTTGHIVEVTLSPRRSDRSIRITQFVITYTYMTDE